MTRPRMIQRAQCQDCSWSGVGDAGWMDEPAERHAEETGHTVHVSEPMRKHPKRQVVRVQPPSDGLDGLREMFRL